MKVILMMAQTVDGKIAKDVDHFTDWTGDLDKIRFKELTTDAGVVIMGSKTYDTIGSPLPNRLNIIMSSDKKRNLTEESLLTEECVFTGLNPKKVLEYIELMEYDTVFLIGGASLNTSFIEMGLVDQIYITIIPKIFGSGISICNNPLDLDLDLMTMEDSPEVFSDGSVLLKYNINKG